MVLQVGWDRTIVNCGGRTVVSCGRVGCVVRLLSDGGTCSRCRVRKLTTSSRSTNTSSTPSWSISLSMSTSLLLDGREGRDAVGVVGEGVDLR